MDRNVQGGKKWGFFSTVERAEDELVDETGQGSEHKFRTEDIKNGVATKTKQKKTVEACVSGT